MTDQDLINALLQNKLLAKDQADRVLREAQSLRRPVEDLIYENKLLDEESVAKTKAGLLGAPWKKIDPDSVSDDLLKTIPRDVVQNYGVVPLERSGKMLVVGMLRPDNSAAQEALRFIAKREELSLGVYLVTPSDFAAIFRRYAPYRSEIDAALREAGNIGIRDERLVSLEEGARTAEEAPIIKIVASTLRQAVEAGASDIHIEPQRGKLRVRLRIDGKLEEVVALPAALSQQVVSRVKVLARLRLDETRIPQDGRFRTVVGGKEIDYRVATFPVPSGEKVAIRVLDPATGLKGLKEIGFNDFNFKIVESSLESPYGMILITGPTGSGKTTTLYAMMQKVNSESLNIVSLEDPVEYFMEGINQSQVRPEIGYDFASGLRQILRQDPDVIMVGEIRDSETASLAVNAALTGHVVLSTLHTNNALGVIPRLIDLGVPSFLLPSAINVMLGQRLVARICPECRKSETAPPEAQKIIERELSELPPSLRKDLSFKPPYSIYRAESKPACGVCKGKGVAGRVAIFEILKMTRELGDVIAAGFTENKLFAEAKRQGMVTLRQDGIIKALEGRVLLEEVLRETE